MSRSFLFIFIKLYCTPNQDTSKTAQPYIPPGLSVPNITREQQPTNRLNYSFTSVNSKEMKNLFVTLTLFILCSAFSQAQDKSPLYGTWILETSIYTSGDTVIKEDKSVKKQMKIVTPDHFMFIISNVAGDKFVMASGGRVIINGDKYTEIIDYTSDVAALNKTYQFSSRVVGDIWYHTGKLDQWKMEEVWKRVK